MTQAEHDKLQAELIEVCAGIRNWDNTFHKHKAEMEVAERRCEALRQRRDEIMALTDPAKAE